MAETQFEIFRDSIQEANSWRIRFRYEGTIMLASPRRYSRKDAAKRAISRARKAARDFAAIKRVGDTPHHFRFLLMAPNGFELLNSHYFPGEDEREDAIDNLRDSAPDAPTTLYHLKCLTKEATT